MILHNFFKYKLVYFKLLIFISILLLGGCASFYEIETNNRPNYIKPDRIAQDFSISGRFSIKSPTKNSYGNFTWTRSSSHEELDLNSPLGQTVVMITIESAIVTLVAQDKTYTGENLNEMMQNRLGFILPLNYLHYWIQGVELPNYPITNKLLDGFEQLNWQIEYLEWHDKNHPRIIQCSKDNLIIKLLIDWPENI